MSNPTIILDWLKSTDISLSVISRNTGVSRKSLYNWKNKITVPTLKSIEKLVLYYNKVIDKEVVKVNSNGKIDYQYVAELQKEKIDSLKEKNETLEALHSKSNMESDIWDSLEYDSITEVRLKLEKFKMYRNITDVGGLNVLSQQLGYSEDELMHKYFCIGEWHIMNKHPVDNIMTIHTKNKLKHYTENFPMLFNAMKTIVGDHYIPLVLHYVGREGQEIQASVYNKVFWKELRVVSKVLMVKSVIS